MTIHLHPRRWLGCRMSARSTTSPTTGVVFGPSPSTPVSLPWQGAAHAALKSTWLACSSSDTAKDCQPAGNGTTSSSHSSRTRPTAVRAMMTALAATRATIVDVVAAASMARGCRVDEIRGTDLYRPCPISIGSAPGPTTSQPTANQRLRQPVQPRQKRAPKQPPRR